MVHILLLFGCRKSPRRRGWCAVRCVRAGRTRVSAPRREIQSTRGVALGGEPDAMTRPRGREWRDEPADLLVVSFLVSSEIFLARSSSWHFWQMREISNSPIGGTPLETRHASGHATVNFPSNPTERRARTVRVPRHDTHVVARGSRTHSAHRRVAIGLSRAGRTQVTVHPTARHRVGGLIEG